MNNKKAEVINGKLLAGVVMSVKTPKTVIVAIESFHRHPLYKKAVRRTNRMAVHNESTELNVGDFVQIRETKPISRTKHFIVVGKITK